MTSCDSSRSCIAALLAAVDDLLRNEKEVEGAVQHVETSTEALLQDIAVHQGHYDFNGYCKVWQIVTKLWDGCVSGTIHKSRTESDVGDRNVARLLQSACALCDVIPEKSKNSEVKVARIAIEARMKQEWLRLKEFQKADATLETVKQQIRVLKEEALDLDEGYQMDQLVQLMMTVSLNSFRTAFVMKNRERCPQLFHIVWDLISNGRWQKELAVELGLSFCRAVIQDAVNIITVAVEDERLVADTHNTTDVMADVCKLLESLGTMEQNEPAVLEQIHNLNRTARATACVSELNSNNAESAWKHLLQLQANPSCNHDGSSENVSSHFESVLRFQILLQMGKAQEAKTHLMELMSNEVSNKTFCLQLLSAFNKCCGQDSASTLTVWSILHDRFPDEVDILLKAAHLLWEKKLTDQSEDDCIHLTFSSEKMRSLIAQQDLKADAFHLFWNHAVDFFHQKNYREASAFFEICYSLGNQEECTKTVRALTLCLIGMKDYTRAVEWMSLHQASQKSAWCSVDCFISFKLALIQLDDEAAVESLNQLTSCQDFTTDLLKIACQEAMANKRHKTALKGLQTLHEWKVKQAAAVECMTEAFILRLIIKCALDDLAAHNSDTDCDALPEVVRHFELILERLDGIGVESFFGMASDHASLLELEWFSDQAWNTAIIASKRNDYKAASMLFSTSAVILSLHPTQQLKQRVHMKAAYLRGVEATLMLFDEHPGSTLDGAKDLMKCARAISCPGDQETEDLLLTLDFGLACRAKQKASLMKILERCRAAKHYSAKRVLQQAMLVKDGEYRDVQACTLALDIALHKLLEESPLLFDQVFEVRRMLIQLCAGDHENLNAYKGALDMIKTYKSQSAAFPEKEIKWLVTSCWNYGCHLSRFRKYHLAKNYLDVSLKLAEHCPAMIDRRSKMQEDMQKLLTTLH